MRYANVQTPEGQPHLSSSTIGKVENSVATVYFNGYTGHVLRTGNIIYTEDGIHLVEFSLNHKDTTENAYEFSLNHKDTTENAYELFFPETHQYFNFGLLKDKWSEMAISAERHELEWIIYNLTKMMRAHFTGVFNYMMSRKERKLKKII